jgi:hypothetical protein
MADDETLFSPAHRNVVARFRTLKQARKAIDALEANGFDAGAIRLEGAGVPARDKADTRLRDTAVPRFVGSHSLAGSIVGGAIGSGLGIIAGAMAGASVTSLVAGGTAGVLIGGIIGLLLAGVGSLDVTPDWERTFEGDRTGPVTVSAGSDDPVKVAQAQSALRDLDPIDLARVDERGAPL